MVTAPKSGAEVIPFIKVRPVAAAHCYGPSLERAFDKNHTPSSYACCLTLMLSHLQRPT
jgi:hypothetical protein